MSKRFLSVCSGIDAASVAWRTLGWEAVAFSEIEPFPSAVLAHHYPDVPNWGDMTKYTEWPDVSVDVLVGGTPCQDTSVGYAAGAGRAGAGFAGARSGLAFSYVGIIRRYRPRVFVWENVPNVLSARHAPGFLAFASRLAELRYHIAWRVLDGRDFRFADQPRPRLYMVGHHRDAAAAGEILLESEGEARDWRSKTPSAPVLTARGGMAFDDRTPCILEPAGARIATPLEWERAMGFPDGYTAIPYRGRPAPDGPRYRALGNSMEVDVIRWIGRRIELVFDLEPAEAAA